MNNNVHYFDIKVAKEIGVIPAIIYQNILYWVDKNKANDNNFFDGYYWTYNSISAFEELFPYLTSSAIRTSLDKLEELKIIKTGNYNKLSFDRTKWYTILKKPNSICQKTQMHLSKIANGFDKSDRPIPDINTDINTDNKPKDIVEQSSTLPYKEIINHLNQKANTNYRTSSKKTQSLIKARFNEGFTEQDFYKVIDNKSSEWLGSDMAKYLRPETLFGTKFESYLNQKVTRSKSQADKFLDLIGDE